MSRTPDPGYVELGPAEHFPQNIPGDLVNGLESGVMWKTIRGGYVYLSGGFMCNGIYAAKPTSAFFALTQCETPPEGLPEIPEGWVLLGRGPHFEATPEDEECRYWHHFSGSTRWPGPFVPGWQDENGWFCVAENGPMAIKYHHRVEFYKQFRQPMNQPPFRPLPENMPPVPDGMVILGWGDQIPYDSNRQRGSVAWWRTGKHSWTHAEDGRLGSGGEGFAGQVHAYEEGHPVLDAFPDAVRFYNPHLFPEPVPTPELIDFSTCRRQWILTLNGAPVASLEELKVLLAPLMASGAECDDLAYDLWTAIHRDDPEGFVAHWADKEPAMLMVDFIHDPTETDILIPTIAESSKTIGEIITTAAAGVLLRGELGNHFRYTEEGRLIINPSNPPSIEQGCEILRRTLEVRETSQKLDNYSAWTLGMLGDELETFFGDDFDPSMVMDATGRCYNTYITSLKVYRKRWAHRKNLSFTHHKEAEFAKVSEEDKDLILDFSDKFRLSVAQQRKVTSFIRVYGSSSLVETEPEDMNDLMERLEVKSVNKNFLFFLRSENKWFRYRGPFEHIPNGASPIINADSKAILSPTGSPTEMAEWTPVGIEVPYLRGVAATAEAERVASIEEENPARPLTPDEVATLVDGFVDAIDDDDEEEGETDW